MAMRLLVIDGQGGGVGSRLVASLREKELPGVQIVCVGTNVLATNAMLKAGADAGATGENAVVYNAARADVILGPIGLLLSNAMLGEITPQMARAISESSAQKVLIPASKCAVSVMEVENQPLSAYIAQAADTVCRLCMQERAESGTQRV